MADSGGLSCSVVPGSHSTNSVHKKSQHTCTASRGRGSGREITGKKRRAQSSQYTPYLKQTATFSKGRKKKEEEKWEWEEIPGDAQARACEFNSRRSPGMGSEAATNTKDPLSCLERVFTIRSH